MKNIPQQTPLSENPNKPIETQSTPEVVQLTPETSKAPETTQEKMALTEKIPTKKEEGFLDETIESLKTKLRKPGKNKPTKIPQVRDQLTVEVEHIMEEGLKEAFDEMTMVQKQEFKIKGEETALQIRQLLKSAHVKVKKIFKLLFEWLKMLPGVNKFFLQQEAKIKADKIVSLHEQRKK